MSLFSVLRTGASGLFAAQAGTQVASQNVANASTDGYSRQTLGVEALGPSPLQGVRTTGSRRVVDQMVERRLLGARAGAGHASARAEALAVLDEVFAEGPGSIGVALSALQSALSDLAADPGDRTARSGVLDAVESVASAFRTAAGELSRARRDINGQISAGVDDVNAALREVAELNLRISEHEHATGREAAELRDRRDELLRGVSEQIPVTVIEQDGGAVSVLLAGRHGLVSPDGRVNELVARPDATSGDVRISVVAAGALEDVTDTLDTGRVGGFVTARDGGLADARTGLDQLAFDVATAYSTAHAAGFGLDGNSGRDLFATPAAAAGAAEAMAISPDVDGLPDRVAAAATATSVPGDGRNVLSMLGLADQTIASGGTETASDAYASLVGQAGYAARSANRAMEQAAAIADQVSALRDGVSGVSTDEEMISLMQFQRAYQASLRVIQTADQMLAELMAIRR